MPKGHSVGGGQNGLNATPVQAPLAHNGHDARSVVGKVTQLQRRRQHVHSKQHAHIVVEVVVEERQ